MRLGPAVALIAALAAGTAMADTTGTALFLSSAELPRDSETLGGFSGIEVSPDGTTLVAISDRGTLFRGEIARTGDSIDAVTFDAGTPLRSTTGQPLSGNYADSEGLAIGADGRVHVSFENQHRILSYAPEIGAATHQPIAPAFRGLQLNSGLEAMAIDDAGRLYVLPERSGHVRRPFPVWRLEDGAWSEVFAIPRQPPHLPVGADFGPDGRLYLLERHFSGFGFSSRVRAFEIAGDRITGETTLLETRTGQFGNLEGLATWRDAEGAIRLTLIADDNFIPFQTSQIVEYVLPLAPAPQTH